MSLFQCHSVKYQCVILTVFAHSFSCPAWNIEAPLCPVVQYNQSVLEGIATYWQPLAYLVYKEYCWWTSTSTPDPSPLLPFMCSLGCTTYEPSLHKPHVSRDEGCGVPLYSDIIWFYVSNHILPSITLMYNLLQYVNTAYPLEGPEHLYQWFWSHGLSSDKSVVLNFLRVMAK